MKSEFLTRRLSFVLKAMGLFPIFFVLSCGNLTTASNEGSGANISAPIPAGVLAKISSPDCNSTFTAEIIVDSKNTYPLSVSPSCETISGRVDNLSPGTHSFTINFKLNNVLVASIGISGTITAGQTTQLNWTSGDIRFFPKIYMTDIGNARIVRMDDMSGTNWTTLGTQGNGTNQFIFPEGIFVDPAGRIYVADSGNNRIVRMDDMAGANWVAFAPTNPSFNGPIGIFVDAAGKIYVADSGNNRIVRIDDMAGTNLVAVSSSGLNQFNFPIGIFVDTTGKIYVSDNGNNRIVRMDDMVGTNWTSLGGTTSGSGTNQFNLPMGIFVDTAGRIYVVDSNNSRIVRMDDMTGTGWTSLGSQGTGNKQFGFPIGVFVELVGRIFVADSGNNHIASMDDMTGTNWATLGTQGAGDGQFSGGPHGIFLR